MRDYFGNLPIVAGMGFMRGIMLLDDCEGTFTWTVAGTGGDDVHEYAAAAAFQGTYGLHLKTRTTGAAADDNVTVTKLCGYPESGLLIARTRLATPDYTKCKSLQFGLLANAGTNSYRAQIKYSPNTPKVEYADAAGALVEMPTLATLIPAGAFSIAEIAMDLTTMTYLHVRWNGTKVDLSGIPLWDAGAATGRYSYVGLIVVAIGANAAELYADNLYVAELLEA